MTLLDGRWHTLTQIIEGGVTRAYIDGRRVLTRITQRGDRTMFEVSCWWCAHPETHDDDTGCQHPGCACSGLL